MTDPDQIANWRRYTKLRTQLYPYVSAAEAEYRRSGMPIMRHLILRYPDDAQAAGAEDEFLFGPDILAAPVVAEGATERDVYLPEGRWVDLWRSAAYDEETGGLELGEAEVLDGEAEATLPAPLEELPLFVRAGAVIPAAAARRRHAREARHGPGNGRPLRPAPADPPAGVPERAKSSGAFNRRGTVLVRGDWRALAARSSRRRERTRFELQAALSAIPGGLEPCSVSANGRKLPGSSWSYDPGAQVLRASFTGRRVTLRASGC